MVTPNTNATATAAAARFSLIGEALNAEASRAIADANGVPPCLKTALVGLIHLVASGADPAELSPFDDAACLGAIALQNSAVALVLARALIERLEADLKETIKIETKRTRDELTRFESLDLE